MPDTLILRFRDVTADDPIRQHRAIISDSGYVWWGWWKKESEPSRVRELGELAERARSGGVTIGLFDRSTRAYFAANVVDCVSADYPIPSPELRRTPTYYAEERVAAWFRITAIEERSEADFAAEFALPPKGEATLFPVWRDSRQRIAVADEVSSDTVRLATHSILHLSDIHLGADFGFPTRARPGATPLLDMIARGFEDEPPGLIVVSGDFTTRADANVLLDEGIRFLVDLSTRLRVPRERFVLVPGNHDIALRRWRPQDYSHETAFRLFVKEFHGEARSYPDLRSFLLPDGRRIEVLTINSVRLRHESEKLFGYVQWQLYDDFLRDRPHDPDVTRIAVLHHHLVSSAREEVLSVEYPEASISTTIDAGAVIEGLQRHGFAMVLHGHQHVPALVRIARATRGTLEGAGREALGKGVAVVAAGSAGATGTRLSDEMRDNSYNLIRLDRAGLDIEARRFSPGASAQRVFRFLLS